jgi:tetratricopeptide (TPR) repeat protein
VPSRPYVPDPNQSSWQVRNPLGGRSHVLPSSGRVNLSHSAPAAAPRGAMTPEIQRLRDQVRVGDMNSVNSHLSTEMNRANKNLGSMLATVNTLHGIQNPNYQQFRTQTMALARTQIAQGSKEAMPWVVVAQMSLQDDNQAEFNEATGRLMREHPNSEYSHFFQGVRRLQDRDFAGAEASLQRARELGMPEESIAELLKTAIDNQKWIWEYALGLSMVVGVWLLGLVFLYLAGKRFSKRTLAGLRADPVASVAGDVRMRRWYRRLIGLASVYYYVSLPIVVCVSIALPLTLGYAMLMVPYLNLVLVAVVFLAGLGGIVTAFSGIRTAFLRVPEIDEGRSVSPQELPSLWALAKEVAAKVGTRAVDEIRLTPGTDLAVFEKGSFVEKLRDRGRRVLILGTAVLEGMKIECLKSILAHEYGHFQNRDTAGGDVALRVYRAMDNFAVAVVLRGKIRRWDVALRFLLAYHLIFRRLTFGASRLQEVFADAAAAAHYGADAFREGLTHVIRRSIQVDWALNKTLGEVIRQGRPALNFYGSPPSPDLGEREELEGALSEQLERPTDIEDSHPGPRDRFSLVRRIDPVVRAIPGEPASKLIEENPQLAAEMKKSVEAMIDERADEITREMNQGVDFLSTVLSRVSDPDALFERAKIYLGRGEYEKGIADLEAILAAAPDAVGILYQRAKALEKLKRFDQAIVDLNRIVQLMNEPSPGPVVDEEEKAARVHVLLNLGRCLASTGRQQEAVKAFTEALRRRPNSLTALVARGRIYRLGKAHAAALADFDEAARQWPGSPEPLIERALVHAIEGRVDLATRDKDAALRLDRKVVETAVNEARASRRPSPPAAAQAGPAAPVAGPAA